MCFRRRTASPHHRPTAEVAEADFSATATQLSWHRHWQAEAILATVTQTPNHTGSARLKTGGANF